MSIDILEKPAFISSGKNIVRVGAAVTNETMRRWAIKNNQCYLDMDVILVELVSHKCSTNFGSFVVTDISKGKRSLRREWSDMSWGRT